MISSIYICCAIWTNCLRRISLRRGKGIIQILPHVMCLQCVGWDRCHICGVCDIVAGLNCMNSVIVLLIIFILMGMTSVSVVCPSIPGEWGVMSVSLFLLKDNCKQTTLPSLMHSSFITLLPLFEHFLSFL